MAIVERGDQTDQAPQVAVGLQHDGTGRDHGGRVDGDHGAGHHHARDRTVAHQPTDQHHVGRLDQDGHVAGSDQGSAGTEGVGQQSHGRQEQRHPGRLVEDKIPVRESPVRQAHGGTEPHAVVVLQDVVGPSGPDQFEHPQPEGDERQGTDSPRPPSPARAGSGRAFPAQVPGGRGSFGLAFVAGADLGRGAILHEMGTLPPPRETGDANAGEASARR
jgi:hypothetical protein